jgi:ribonuclease PH
MTSTGGFIEVQGIAEGAPFQPEEPNAMLELAKRKSAWLKSLDWQKAALADRTDGNH